MSDSFILNRRRFILNAAQLTLGAAVTWGAGARRVCASSLELSFGKLFAVLQGVTTECETQLTVDVPDNMNVHFRLVDSQQNLLINPTEVRVTQLSGGPWTVQLIKFSGLTPHKIYLFQICDQEGLVLDERELQTLDLTLRNPRVAFISCACDIYENKTVWETLVNSRPDLLIFMGDNVYGDLLVVPGPENLTRRYIEARSRNFIYRSKKLIPSLAIWDDHDYGKNNEDGNYKHKESSLRIFNTFYGRDEVENVYSQGPGVASCFRAFGLQFLMLDDRYFRSDKSNRNGQMLGDAQMNWAFKQLRDFNGPSWLINGNQFFGAQSARESFEGSFRRDFYGFLDGVRACGQPVLFAGGDVHHSETMTIENDILGYETYELTSSGIHSHASPSLPKNDRRRQSTTKRNFVEVTHSWRNDQLDLNFRSIDKRSDILFLDSMSLSL